MSRHSLTALAKPAWGLTATLGSLTLAGGLLLSYAFKIEPRWAELVRITLALPHLPPAFDGLTLAHISDIHASAGVNTAQIRHHVSAVNAFRPDITVVTGDMMQHFSLDAEMCARELASLRAPLGVYVILGNHERRIAPAYGEEPFRLAGLDVLCNEAREIKGRGSSVWLLGMDDMLTRHGDLATTLSAVPEQACKILLVHEPDFADHASRFTIDLQLSGHTHGGQIRLPGLGPLMLPVLGRKYPMGLYRVRNMWLYTNRGLGAASPTLRFNCRPEITLFTLTTEHR